MTHLWLVRHGQTDWNLAGRYQGQANPPLNAYGEAQAEAIAAWLEGQPIAAIYCSDLQRAQRTAEIIARRVKLTIAVDHRLREIDLGQWEGMLTGDIQARYPDEWADRLRDPLYAPAPGGETLVIVAHRVWAAADDIAAAHPRGIVLIVSHGLALATLLCRARALPLEQAYHFVPENARLVTIEWGIEKPGGAVIRARRNEGPFLERQKPDIHE
jgi:broad specificity phosphatase PhoE